MSYVTKSNTVIYFIISVILVFIALIGGQFIEDTNLRMAYFMLFFLLFVSFSNIYLAQVFYTMLRNDPGVKGDRGDPGDKGPPGTDGVCTSITNCEITDCKKLIERELSKKIPEYKEVLNKQKENLELNDFDRKVLRKINNFIDGTMNPICQKWTGGKKDFINILENELENL